MPIPIRPPTLARSVNATSIEKLLSTPINPIGSPNQPKTITQRKLGYVYDPEQLALSYSRRQTLNRCPRLFQLRELKQRKSRSASIDTAFGSAFGAGVQELWRTGSIERATVAALAAWDYPEFTDMYGKKHNKSFGTCVETLAVYTTHIHPMLTEEYDLAEVEGKSGIELFCFLKISESCNYQIHIDLVLQNKHTKALAVVEIKTSGMSADEAQWGNSEQTLGYYAMMEVISRRLNLPIEPMVYYICVEAGKMHDSSCNYGFQIFPFVKTGTAMLDFVSSLMYDVNRINYSLETDFFPKNGANCIAYRSRCEFYGSCDMFASMPEETGNIYESLTMDDVDFVLDISEIISTVENNFLT